MTTKRIFMTGATGTMGIATLDEFLRSGSDARITVLARPSKANRKKLARYEKMHGFGIIWGDLLDRNCLEEGCRGADFVLHFGGLVSPAADYDATKTLRLNILSSRRLVEAIKKTGGADKTTFVYIGSVAESGDRRPPHHWGRTGDPLIPSLNDPYALSKIIAEKDVIDSGLRRWIVFRQTGILCPSILKKGSDPITFHVPHKGLLEWTTAEETGTLMMKVATEDLPDSFFNHFYDIGGGKGFRVVNYEFEKMLLKALMCPPPEKVFRPQWFALHNFHGQWFADSDKLEHLLPYRRYASIEDYFKELARQLPWWMRLTPLAPAPLIRFAMRKIAERPPLGPLSWKKTGDYVRIRNAFGSVEEMESVPSDWAIWHTMIDHATPEPRDKRVPGKMLLPHGYDETKPEDELDIADMREKATFLGGECLTHKMARGDLSSPLRWRCSHRHEFTASPAAVLLGGHWCPDCLVEAAEIPGISIASLKDLLKD